MLLPKGQVITFKGRDGAARAGEMVLELRGRAERFGNSVHIRHSTTYLPKFAADIEQFGFEEAVHGRNGRREAARV